MGMEEDEIRSLPDCRFIHLDCRTGTKKTLDLYDEKDQKHKKQNP
jgi:hypothetical protein